MGGTLPKIEGKERISTPDGLLVDPAERDGSGARCMGIRVVPIHHALPYRANLKWQKESVECGTSVLSEIGM